MGQTKARLFFFICIYFDSSLDVYNISANVPIYYILQWSNTDVIIHYNCKH